MRVNKSVLAGALAALLTGVLGVGDGAAATRRSGPPSEGAAPPLGATELFPEVKGLTTLVVGDSWAMSLGVGMTKAGKPQGNTIVLAGQAACSIMLGTMEAPGGIVGPVRPACRTWPKVWPLLVERYRPRAVVLATTYWDSVPQVIDGTGTFRTIADPVFRRRYQANMDRAIDILSARGAAVFVGNAVLTRNPKLAALVNREVAAVVARNAGRGVHLLDLYHQFCDAGRCPERTGGLDVYDPTGHPTVPVRDRLGRWALNTLWTTTAGRTTA